MCGASRRSSTFYNDSCRAIGPVAQRIEHRSTKPKARVRFSPGSQSSQGGGRSCIRLSAGRFFARDSSRNRPRTSRSPTRSLTMVDHLPPCSLRRRFCREDDRNRGRSDSIRRSRRTDGRGDIRRCARLTIRVRMCRSPRVSAPPGRARHTTSALLRADMQGKSNDAFPQHASETETRRGAWFAGKRDRFGVGRLPLAAALPEPQPARAEVRPEGIAALFEACGNLHSEPHTSRSLARSRTRTNRR